MTIILRPNGAGQSPPFSPYWPSGQTVAHSLLIGANLGCTLLNSSTTTAVGLNIPLRLFSFWQALLLNSPYKALFDTVALGTSLYSQGRLFNAGFDIIFEIFNFYKAKKEKEDQPFEIKLTKRGDPTILEDALKGLGIPLEKATDRDFIKAQRDKTINFFEVRKKKTSAPLAKAVQSIIDDTNIAYETIMKSLPPEEK